MNSDLCVTFGEATNRSTRPRRWTMRALFFLLVSLSYLPVHADGLGVGDYKYLDEIKVDAKTGAVTLLLVIDRPLEDGLTKARVRRKMLGYNQWIYARDELNKKHPNADLSKTPTLLIMHPEATSALGNSVLEQLVAYAKELRFAPVTRPMPVKK